MNTTLDFNHGKMKIDSIFAIVYLLKFTYCFDVDGCVNTDKY